MTNFGSRISNSVSVSVDMEHGKIQFSVAPPLGRVWSTPKNSPVLNRLSCQIRAASIHRTVQNLAPGGVPHRWVAQNLMDSFPHAVDAENFIHEVS